MTRKQKHLELQATLHLDAKQLDPHYDKVLEDPTSVEEKRKYASPFSSLAKEYALFVEPAKGAVAFVYSFQGTAGYHTSPWSCPKASKVMDELANKYKSHLVYKELALRVGSFHSFR